MGSSTQTGPWRTLSSAGMGNQPASAAKKARITLFARSGYPRPPLLYKHDPEQVDGTIANLDYEDRGQVRIVADVNHELARRCNAFSICAAIIQYEIRNADSADFFALITKAKIDEESLLNFLIRIWSGVLLWN